MEGSALEWTFHIFWKRAISSITFIHILCITMFSKIDDRDREEGGDSDHSMPRCMPAARHGIVKNFVLPSTISRLPYLER